MASSKTIKERKIPRTITVAMVKDPEGTRWQAQVQMEYKGGSIDALEFVEDSPMHCMNRLSKAVAKRCFGVGAVIIE